MDSTLPHPTRSQAYLALIFGVLCVAWAATLVKLAGAPGPVSAFYRLFFASLVLLPWQASNLPLRQSPRLVWLGLAAGVLFALNAAMWNTSLLLTSAANSTVLANTAPLWIGLASLWLLKHKLPRLFWPGMTIALVGMVVMVGRDLLAHPQVGWGDLLALGSAFLYGASLMLTHDLRRHLSAPVVSTLLSVAGVVVLLGLNVARGTPLTGYSAQTWLALIALGLVSHVGGLVSVNYALAYFGAAVTSVTMLGQAVLSSTIALIVLGETLSAWQVVGGALVLGGVWLVHKR